MNQEQQDISVPQKKSAFERLSLFINTFSLGEGGPGNKETKKEEGKRISQLVDKVPQFRRESKIYKMAPSIRGIARQVNESEMTEQKAEEVKRLF